jgi:SpoIIAA-like
MSRREGGVVLKELSGMPPGIHALEAVATVTADDYGRVFAPLVDRALRSGSRMRLLYQFGPGFQGITAGALWADTRLGLRYLRILDGCAVVSDIGWVRAPARGIGAWMPCPTRVYGNDERDDAAEWLASLDEAAGVTVRDIATTYVGGVAAAAASLAGLALSRGGHPASPR